MKKSIKVLLLTAILIITAISAYHHGHRTPDTSFGWKFPTAYGISFSRSEGYSKIRDRDGLPQGLPVHLSIPSIGVDAAIEDALITPDGKMDVPAGSVNVAWFALGPRPGQPGSAVIGGHFGMDQGVPKVFYNLQQLKSGDTIYVVDDMGDSRAFVVRSAEVFNRDADATRVFTSDDGLAHLNLIACEGTWNQVDDSYPQRRVVFADSISLPEEIAPAMSAPARGTWGRLASFTQYVFSLFSRSIRAY